MHKFFFDRFASTRQFVLVVVMLSGVVSLLRAQGPMPEEGATLFPHGALVSVGSTLVSGTQRGGTNSDPSAVRTHPTLASRMPFTFSWSFRRDLQFSAQLPLVTKQVDWGQQSLSETGIGDALMTLKYRFLRLDSERGTTQMSFTFGPKFATGSTSRRGPNGNSLPVELQPGTGTTDLFVKTNLTYTGLFHSRRLVADPSFSYQHRFGSAEGVRKGHEAEARLWVHYRPLQTRLVGGEWFIGPTLTWQHAARNSRSGLSQPATGFDVFSMGVTSYISPKGGLVFWGAVDFPMTQDWNGAAFEQDRRFHFGITKQFVLQP